MFQQHPEQQSRPLGESAEGSPRSEVKPVPEISRDLLIETLVSLAKSGKTSDKIVALIAKFDASEDPFEAYDDDQKRELFHECRGIQYTLSIHRALSEESMSEALSNLKAELDYAKHHLEWSKATALDGAERLLTFFRREKGHLRPETIHLGLILGDIIGDLFFQDHPKQSHDYHFKHYFSPDQREALQTATFALKAYSNLGKLLTETEAIPADGPKHEEFEEMLKESSRIAKTSLRNLVKVFCE